MVNLFSHVSFNLTCSSVALKLMNHENALRDKVNCNLANVLSYDEINTCAPLYFVCYVILFIKITSQKFRVM